MAAVIAEPNKSVKGTRRPLAVLKFSFYQGLAASLKFSERRAPYRNVMWKRIVMSSCINSYHASILMDSILNGILSNQSRDDIEAIFNDLRLMGASNINPCRECAPCYDFIFYSQTLQKVLDAAIAQVMITAAAPVQNLDVRAVPRNAESGLTPLPMAARR